MLHLIVLYMYMNSTDVYILHVHVAIDFVHVPTGRYQILTHMYVYGMTGGGIMNDLSLHLSVRYRSCPRPATSLSSDVYHRVRVAMFTAFLFCRTSRYQSPVFFSLRFALRFCRFRLRLFLHYCPPSTGAAYM